MIRQEYKKKPEIGISQVLAGHGIVKTMKALEHMAEEKRIALLQLPDPADFAPHPQLLLEGRGIHAVDGYTALFPDGWHDITLEVSCEPTGPGCWSISTPGFVDIGPLDLFVKV